MTCYFTALINIHNPDRYKQYLEGYDEIFYKYNGKVLAVDEKPGLLEGSWPSKRTVIIEFPDEVELRRWYESEEYQFIASHRKAASTSSIAIIHGR